MRHASAVSGLIRAGIGGWTFEPWRGLFYPAGLPKSRELAYAGSKLRTLEINGTFYSLQTPETFAAWREAVPADFVFTLKGSRFITHRRVLAEAGDAMAKFFASGIAELGPKLGPVVWQFAPTKAFDAADFGAFLALLPRAVEGVALRHAVEVRHPSFATPDFVALARAHGVGIVFGESADHPRIADLTADFVYLRVMRAEAGRREGYAPATLDAMAACARVWAAGGEPAGVPRIGPPAPRRPRDVFVQFISAAKERNPAAALALQRRVEAAG